MGIFGGGKKDTRPVDEGLAHLRGVDEKTAVEFWKKRFRLTASVPDDNARVGALTPQIRELTRVEQPERTRLTRARLIAFAQLTPQERQTIVAAHLAAFDVDRRVLEDDQKLVDQILPTMDETVRAAYPQHRPQ